MSPIITTALGNYFKTLKPGDTVIKAKLVGLMMDVAGVIDVAMSAPAANVAAIVDSTHVQLATLGTLSLS